MKIEVLFEEKDTHIRGDDFAISSTNNLMIFTLAKFLSDNAIEKVINEIRSENPKIIEFEVEDNLFEKIMFSFKEK